MVTRRGRTLPEEKIEEKEEEVERKGNGKREVQKSEEMRRKQTEVKKKR